MTRRNDDDKRRHAGGDEEEEEEEENDGNGSVDMPGLYGTQTNQRFSALRIITGDQCRGRLDGVDTLDHGYRSSMENRR